MNDDLGPINAVALTWRFTRSGGPGGQHANKTSTQVELDCDVASCGFSGMITDRIIGTIGPTVQLVVTDTRSQVRNRDIAEQRLREILTAAAAVPRTRRATKPKRSAVEDRLQSKKRNSQRKAERGRPTSND